MTARRDAARLLLQLAGAPLVALRRWLHGTRDCAGCSDRPCYEEAP